MVLVRVVVMATDHSHDLGQGHCYVQGSRSWSWSGSLLWPRITVMILVMVIVMVKGHVHGPGQGRCYGHGSQS